MHSRAFKTAEIRLAFAMPVVCKMRLLSLFGLEKWKLRVFKPPTPPADRASPVW